MFNGEDEPKTADDFIKGFLKYSREMLESVPQTVSRASGNGLTYQAVPEDGHSLFNAVSLYVDENQDDLRRGDINAVRNGSESADNLEIDVLMEVLNRPIVIMGPDGKIRNLGDVDRYPGEPIFVYYNGNNHYDGLLLTDEYRNRSGDVLANLKKFSEHGEPQEPLLSEGLSTEDQGKLVDHAIATISKILPLNLPLGLVGIDCQKLRQILLDNMPSVTQLAPLMGRFAKETAVSMAVSNGAVEKELSFERAAELLVAKSQGISIGQFVENLLADFAKRNLVNPNEIPNFQDYYLRVATLVRSVLLSNFDDSAKVKGINHILAASLQIPILNAEAFLQRFIRENFENEGCLGQQLVNLLLHDFMGPRHFHWSGSFENNFGYHHRESPKVDLLRESTPQRLALDFVVSQLDVLIDFFATKCREIKEKKPKEYYLKFLTLIQEKESYYRKWLDVSKGRLLALLDEASGVQSLPGVAENFRLLGEISSVTLPEVFSSSDISETEAAAFLLFNCQFKCLLDSCRRDLKLISVVREGINQNDPQFLENLVKGEKEVFYNRVGTFIQKVLAFCQNLLKLKERTTMGIGFVGEMFSVVEDFSNFSNNMIFVNFPGEKRDNNFERQLFLWVLSDLLNTIFSKRGALVRVKPIMPFPEDESKYKDYVFKCGIQMFYGNYPGINPQLKLALRQKVLNMALASIGRKQKIFTEPLIKLLNCAKEDVDVVCTDEEVLSVQEAVLEAIGSGSCVELGLSRVIHQDAYFSVWFGPDMVSQEDKAPIELDGRPILVGSKHRALIPPCDTSCQITAFVHIFWAAVTGFIKLNDDQASVVMQSLVANKKASLDNYTAGFLQAKGISGVVWKQREGKPSHKVSYFFSPESRVLSGELIEHLGQKGFHVKSKESVGDESGAIELRANLKKQH